MNHPHFMVATDLLPKSRPALARTAILAGALGANVTLMHVVPLEPWDEAAAGRARDALEQITQIAREPIWTGVPQPNTIVSTGSPARVILEVPTRRDSIAGEPVQKRLGALADALGRKGEILVG